jgi:N-acetylglucosaminyldiphosphoundecaprenol N-acetyl-beta-D-mannosaminyltransferase
MTGTKATGPDGSARVDLPTAHLFGLDFVADATIDQVVEQVMSAARPEAVWRSVVTPNVDHLVRYRTHSAEKEVARRAWMLLPDGMPIVWSSRLLGKRLNARLTGSDLFTRLWPRLAADGIPAVVVSPNAEVSAKLAAEHELCRFVEPLFFDEDDVEAIDGLVAEIDHAVRESFAAVVFICLSLPKHHAVAERLRTSWDHPRVPQPVVLLLGAAAEFHVGARNRAPDWMGRLGLEWLHRLVGDPKRMARRYLIDGLAFVPILIDEYRTGRR